LFLAIAMAFYYAARLLQHLLPLVYKLGALVDVMNGADVPRYAGDRQFPRHFEARRLREDRRVRQRVYLVVQSILEARSFVYL